jgi:uncharacterized protein (TIGR02246 family)
MSFIRSGLCLALSLVVGGQLPGQDGAGASDTAGQPNAAQASEAGPDGPSIELQAATEQIRQAVRAYTDAFNARDVEALGAMWTSEGVYIMRTTGQRVVGRDAITQQFKPLLADEKTAPQLAVASESIEFISPRVALERGTAVVSSGDDDVSESQYTAVYVKENGKWLLDRVSEDEVFYVPSHYEQLQGLQWLIGDWVDAGDGITIDIQCDWTANRNFISRKYSVSTADGFQSSGLQIIGWDAKEKTIRSWLFDSDGGFVTGTWSQRDGNWIVQSVATLADGASGSSTSIFKPQDDGTYRWQKINQVVDGKLMPNIDEIVVQPK